MVNIHFASSILRNGLSQSERCSAIVTMIRMHPVALVNCTGTQETEAGSCCHKLMEPLPVEPLPVEPLPQGPSLLETPDTAPSGAYRDISTVNLCKSGRGLLKIEKLWELSLTNLCSGVLEAGEEGPY